MSSVIQLSDCRLSNHIYDVKYVHVNLGKYLFVNEHEDETDKADYI